jgi:Fur family ferric uptake transcriptional regulator
MDSKRYTDMAEILTQYLEKKKMRKTEERSMILRCICSFPSHFDISQLSQKLEEINFHVSLATLYNTLDILEDCRIVVRHQSIQSTLYELRILAETHQHLICTKCGAIRDLKNVSLKQNIENLKIPRFNAEYYALYIYGICSKCKYKLSRKKQI